MCVDGIIMEVMYTDGGGAVAPCPLAIYALKHYVFPYDPSHTLMWKTEYI